MRNLVLIIRIGYKGRRGPESRLERQFVAVIDVNARIAERHFIREIKLVRDEVFGRLG